VHRNERLLRDAYTAMANGDGRALAKLLTVDSQWIIPGTGLLAGVHTGPGEIFEFWKRTATQTGGGLPLEVDDVLANDERAIVLVTVEGSRGDRRLRERQVAIFEIHDGTVKSARFIYENPKAYDDFWTD
jgi:ketosteroid isomerase-like protein